MIEDLLLANDHVLNSSVSFWFPVFYDTACLACDPELNCTSICQDGKSMSSFG